MVKTKNTNLFFNLTIIKIAHVMINWNLYVLKLSMSLQT